MADVSRITGISRSTFSNWMRWDRYPSADNGEKIAQALGVSVEWLVTGAAIYQEDDEVLDSPRIEHLIKTVLVMDSKQLNALEPVLNYMVNPTGKKRRKKSGPDSKPILNDRF